MSWWGTPGGWTSQQQWGWAAWKGTNTGFDQSINSATSNDTPMPIPTPTPAAAVTSPGGLHCIWEGIGDMGEGLRIPQTLHTIEQGISA
jgi:hypothetical protein